MTMGQVSFNRTFMELKFGEYGSNSLRPHWVLIVPLWN